MRLVSVVLCSGLTPAQTPTVSIFFSYVFSSLLRVPTLFRYTLINYSLAL